MRNEYNPDGKDIRFIDSTIRTCFVFLTVAVSRFTIPMKLS